MKTTNLFSGTLFKRDMRTNAVLTAVILVIMILMSTVVNFAMSVMAGPIKNDETEAAQKDFYSYLSVFTVVNKMNGTTLSYADFKDSSDHSTYDMVFKAAAKNPAFADVDIDLSTDGFEAAIDTLSKYDVPIETYVEKFEYVYALNSSKGVFSGDELDASQMITTMLETMGVNSDLVENMSKMDTTTILNQMYFTVIGLLPLFLYLVIAANGLLASQVDSGSLAYVLSTPIKRKAVAITQTTFMILAPLVIVAIVCATRIASSFAFYDEVCVERIIMLYLGMYILSEAVAGICYLGSCLFNLSKRSMAFGGGLTVWFFLASLLGLFGSEDFINMGVGVEQLGIFNKLTLIGLYDIKSIATIGTDSLDTAFVWKSAVLAVTAIVCYAAGSVRFCKKDLPL